MPSRRHRYVIAAIVLTLAAASAPAVAARKNKKVFKATIDGKRFRPTPRTIGLTAGGGTIAFSGTGTKLAGLRGFSKLVYIACADDLDIQTFPFTAPDCLTSYTETRARPLTTRTWTQLQFGGTDLTVDSYDGTHMAAHFHAVVPAGPTNPSLPPVTIDGEFRGPVKRESSTR